MKLVGVNDEGHRLYRQLGGPAIIENDDGQFEAKVSVEAILLRGGWRKPADGGKAEHKAAGDDQGDLFGDLSDDDMIEAMEPIIVDAVQFFGNRVYEQVKLEPAFDVLNPRVVEFLREYGATRIKELVGTTTRAALGNTIAEGRELGEDTFKLMTRIRQVFENANRDRARMIAETEITIASAVGVQGAIDELQIERKQWLSTGRDGHTRNTHLAMHGQIVAGDAKFKSPSGDSGLGPGLFQTARENVFCRCSAIPLPEGTDDDDLVPPIKSEVKARDLTALWEEENKARRVFRKRMEEAVHRGFAAQETKAIHILMMSAW